MIRRIDQPQPSAYDDSRQPFRKRYPLGSAEDMRQREEKTQRGMSDLDRFRETTARALALESRIKELDSALQRRIEALRGSRSSRPVYELGKALSEETAAQDELDAYRHQLRSVVVQFQGSLDGVNGGDLRQFHEAVDRREEILTEADRILRTFEAKAGLQSPPVDHALDVRTSPVSAPETHDRIKPPVERLYPYGWRDGRGQRGGHEHLILSFSTGWGHMEDSRSLASVNGNVGAQHLGVRQSIMLNNIKGLSPTSQVGTETGFQAGYRELDEQRDVIRALAAMGVEVEQTDGNGTHVRITYVPENEYIEINGEKIWGPIGTKPKPVAPPPAYEWPEPPEGTSIRTRYDKKQKVVYRERYDEEEKEWVRDASLGERTLSDIRESNTKRSSRSSVAEQDNRSAPTSAARKSPERVQPRGTLRRIAEIAGRNTEARQACERLRSDLQSGSFRWGNPDLRAADELIRSLARSEGVSIREMNRVAPRTTRELAYFIDMVLAGGDSTQTLVAEAAPPEKPSKPKKAPAKPKATPASIPARSRTAPASRPAAKPAEPAKPAPPKAASSRPAKKAPSVVPSVVPTTTPRVSPSAPSPSPRDPAYRQAIPPSTPALSRSVKIPPAEPKKAPAPVTPPSTPKPAPAPANVPAPVEAVDRDAALRQKLQKDVEYVDLATPVSTALQYIIAQCDIGQEMEFDAEAKRLLHMRKGGSEATISCDRRKESGEKALNFLTQTASIPGKVAVSWEVRDGRVIVKAREIAKPKPAAAPTPASQPNLSAVPPPAPAESKPALKHAETSPEAMAGLPAIVSELRTALQSTGPASSAVKAILQKFNEKVQENLKKIGDIVIREGKMERLRALTLQNTDAGALNIWAQLQSIEIEKELKKSGPLVSGNKQYDLTFVNGTGFTLAQRALK